MNDAPLTLDELISRHFDEALPPAEHQRLTEALNTDFEARLDFVEAARLHAGLEALAPALPPLKKRHVIRWLIAGAAAALMLGSGALFLHQSRSEPVRIVLKDMDALPDGKTEESKPTGLAKRVVKAPAAVLGAGAEPVDVQKLLEHYYVNVSPHGFTVPHALVQLEEAIKEMNILCRPELNQLSFKAGAAISSRLFDSRVSITAAIPMTVRQYLNSCSKLRQVLQEPGGQRYGDPEFPIRYTEGINEREKFQLERDSLLRSLKNMDLGYGPTPQRSVSLKLITLNRYLLPIGFDENAGLILTDEAFQKFDESLPRKSPQRWTDWIEHKSDPIFGTHLNYIDLIGSLWANIPKPDWLSIRYSFESSFQGEMILVSGSVASEGWNLGTETEKLNGPGPGVKANSNLNGVNPGNPTEFEVWMQPKQKAIFALDGSSGDLVTIVCVSIEIATSNKMLKSRPTELYAPK